MDAQAVRWEHYPRVAAHSAHAMRNELLLSGKVALERPSWHSCLL